MKEKISEQEKMLDLISNSITHCNQQIKFYTDKIINENTTLNRQEYEVQKVVFEDNKLIWNIAGFITLISIDIKTIQTGLYFAETEWRKRFYARQACTIMYESSQDISELLGKEFREFFSKRVNIIPLESELRGIRSRLNLFKEEYKDYLSMVRNNTSAHKDKDVLKQIEVISDINWSNIVLITMKFEGIINDLGTFLQKIINIGLNNLKYSPLGQKKI